MARHKWDPRCPFPDDLVRPAPRDRTGQSGPTRGQAAGTGWRRVAKGYYVPAGTDSDRPEQRTIEAAHRLAPGGAITGWAALRWQGANFLDGLARDGRTPIPVPLLLGHRAQVQRDGQVRLSYEKRREWEIWTRHGLRVTRPEKAAWDEMRQQRDWREALVVAEMVVAAGLTSPERIRAYAVAHRSDRRAKHVWPALDRITEHSRSPQEVRMRVRAEDDAGLPRLLVNCPVHSREGQLLGVADLLDLEAGLALEYDGEDHRAIDRHTVDVNKDEQFRRRRLELTRITARDLRDEGLVVDRILSARRRAHFEPVEDRLWVPTPPEDTLEETLQQQELGAMLHQWWDSLPPPLAG